MRVHVDEACFHAREGPSDGAVGPVRDGEPAAERHPDLGHAEALEEDVAAAQVGPRAFGGGGERGGPGDGEPEVGWGDGGARGALHVRREGPVGGEQAGVDGWDGGEEGDLAVLVVRRVGVVGLVRCEEGRGEAPPDGVGVEGEEELDCAAGEEGGENGVDGAVYVMKREDVEEVVGGGVLPRLE